MKVLVICITLVFALLNTNAQTTVSGEVSGTWELSGSPYYILEDCIIPRNNKLEIKPGVKVIIAGNTSINVYGNINAIGNPENYIEFTSPNDTTFWNRIYIQYSGTDTSRFEFCKLNHATTAISLKIGYKSAGTMITEISNCTFENCLEHGVFGESHGLSDWNASHNPNLNPRIQNCIFDETTNGLFFYMHGYKASWQATSAGNLTPDIRNNIFKNLKGTALFLSAGSVPGNSSNPVFQNNTVMNCNKCIVAEQPFNTLIKNNIFKGNNYGIERTGSTTSQVAYNCFYENDSSDFIGFPTSFGSVVMRNSNDDLCDIGFNIFLDPIFSDTTILKLNNFSPCIDAGDPNTDGDIDGTIADLGAYGGPGATNWIVTENRDIPSLSLVDFTLHQNYPNPFNSSTNINYELQMDGEVEVSVYDFYGRKIRTLDKGWRPAGIHQIIWNCNNDLNSNIKNGTYFLELRFNKAVEVKKMIYLK